MLTACKKKTEQNKKVSKPKRPRVVGCLWASEQWPLSPLVLGSEGTTSRDSQSKAELTRDRLFFYFSVGSDDTNRTKPFRMKVNNFSLIKLRIARLHLIAKKKKIKTDVKHSAHT